jgi:uncharacterized membrane protein YdfJ with MMPL/SSD domain
VSTRSAGRFTIRPTPFKPRRKPHGHAHNNLTGRLGRWSAAHPWRSIGAWLLLVGVAVAGGTAIGTKQLNQNSGGNGSSGPADAAVSRAFPQSATEQVLVHSAKLTATAPAFRSAVDDVVGRVQASQFVTRVALLSVLGDRVERGRIPFVTRRRRAEAESKTWGRALDLVLRRPVLAAAITGGALLAMAVPVLHMHTAAPGISDLPQNLPVVQTLNQIQAAFPGGPAPATVVIEAHDVTAPPVQAGIAPLERAALATGQMNRPISTMVSVGRTVEVVSIPLAGSSEDMTSNRALHTLRDDVIPATVGRVVGTTVNVSGLTAVNQDWNNLLHRAMPLVFGFVLLLAFALLLVSFRSLVIAANAIVLNLLSVGAAYGVLVCIFQYGHLHGLLGFHSTHAIASWLPLLVFCCFSGCPWTTTSSS